MAIHPPSIEMGVFLLNMIKEDDNVDEFTSFEEEANV